MTSMFEKRLAQLQSDLVTQGARVVDLLLGAIDAYFSMDPEKAAEIVKGDDVIDKADVEIERASIPLLAMGETDPHRLRAVLTIVKVNNELERIADCAVSIAEAVQPSNGTQEAIPPTFRVMANSVVGILRDATRALGTLDTKLAQQVLGFDDTVLRFEQEILGHAQRKVTSGEFSVEFAFRLLSVTKLIERIADHCTNICEQVIYLQTGRVVRHLPQGWTEPALPDV